MNRVDGERPWQECLLPLPGRGSHGDASLCINQQLTHGEAVSQALVVLFYPIVFFFGFLYYTDAGSLFFVVAMLVLARRGRVSQGLDSGKSRTPPCAVSLRLTESNTMQ